MPQIENQLPSADDISAAILERSPSEWTSWNPKTLEYFLDVNYPVFAQFVVEETPQGHAPEAIREDWVGLSLPVRANAESDGALPIVAFEAVDQLEHAGKQRSARWWKRDFIPELPPELNNATDIVSPEELAKKIAHSEILSKLDFSLKRSEGVTYWPMNVYPLIFDSECGQLQPTQTE